MSTPANDRARAARLLVTILHQGRTTDQSFDDDISPLCAELVYGSLRHYFSLAAAITRKLDRELRTKDLDIRCLMIVGAYQLAFTRIPEHAAINETVGACRQLRKPWAKGLVNAVLRSFARNATTIERSFELPDWIETRLHSEYGNRAESIMTALLERAPMSLRVNTTQMSLADYGLLLDTAAIAWHRGSVDQQIVLESPRKAATLPGYAEGLVSIQDGGAQFAAGLFDGLNQASQVLDACAAPGGKLFHLAERRPDLQLTALEISEPRLQHLQQESRRLHHNAVHWHLADASAPTTPWWSGSLFDAIMVDAPCSGIGTLRRHPDIKHLRQPGDLPGYRRQQDNLLGNLWRMLRTGGNLLYCTCSLFREENDDVVGNFLDIHADAAVVPIKLPSGVATSLGWQIYPLPDGERDLPDSADGFYYALIGKRE